MFSLRHCHIYGTKSRQSVLILGGLLLCSRAHADFISAPMPLPPNGGAVTERGKKGTQVIIQWTGQIPKAGGSGSLLGMTPVMTIGDSGQLQFPVPATSSSADGKLKNQQVKDYIQFSKDPGPTSVLMLEAFVPSGSDFVQYPFLDYIASIDGPGVTISVPDLYSSNDPNSDATLYEAVNLSVYMANLPAFNIGDTFNVVNGTVAGLPGMFFGTVEQTLDPSSPSGFDNPSPYSGPGYTLSAHDNVVTPEPTYIFPVGAVMIMLAIRRKAERLSGRRRLAPKLSPMKRSALRISALGCCGRLI
jgi:hypothetical protein